MACVPPHSCLSDRQPLGSLLSEISGSGASAGRGPCPETAWQTPRDPYRFLSWGEGDLLLSSGKINAFVILRLALFCLAFDNMLGFGGFLWCSVRKWVEVLDF